MNVIEMSDTEFERLLVNLDVDMPIKDLGRKILDKIHTNNFVVESMLQGYDYVWGEE